MAIHSEPQTGAGSEAPAGPKEKPHLVVGAASIAGHTLPLLEVAAALIKRGYTVSFITSKEFAPQVERAGAELVPIPDALSGAGAAAVAESHAMTPGSPAMIKHALRTIFLGSIPARHEALKQHLEHLAEVRPGQQVILLLEIFFLGAEALLHGAPLPRGYDRLPRTIGLSIAPVLVHSVDTGPVGTALPPDSTPSGRLRNALLNSIYEGQLADLNEERAAMLRGLGATRDPTGWLFGDWFTAAEVTLQTCAPSLEYERSDLPPSIRYIGALPARPVPAGLAYPAWWPDLDGKKVVAVAQGTVATDPHALIAPTLRALAGGRGDGDGDDDDVIVVALLGVRGASLPADVEVPANARVLDYFPYEALLARADVFVQNAGYGGVQTSIMHGVPLVVAGVTEDKAEMSMRVQCAGIGVNLATSTPTSEQVRAAVKEVLANPAYRQRVLAMKKENEDLDALAKIEAQIVEFTE
ncbi:hypothetical protein GGTG_05932 [Gaeumannomyces tritici R3-111a-1]|uniref:Erythromycin biosynthesis protein CIII-like C-terminal domain-containing protein n=1 Tax=Gaeumannomyces tritici (strain R3-111a-1) TaxID=644352 RepID=J3NXC5_GAET3|nr:hypothetical protein GGTG_05932 [Gaeumannomyces tritici R3-111a-1]EJT76007.1 hypothetical protein GGTG_05932 [Gaeumannomyces tritici R3-111a-1]